MIFGSEYEKVLAFIDTNNTGYTATAHENKQETIAHKSGNVTQSGKELDTIKNIVDLEGNLREWTAQANSTSYRVIRGGDYNRAISGNFNPASNSNYDYPSNTYSFRCTRQTLYVTL